MYNTIFSQDIFQIFSANMFLTAYDSTLCIYFWKVTDVELSMNCKSFYPFLYFYLTSSSLEEKYLFNG